ncbi:helix-turn-helix transcriptional regulator [Olsenella uli]|uniref:helix-turn-helix domain-containing protein n=1 Tax=Olsenella uli TaxID=133926 RepID=UPI001D6DBCED|nr:helix-turn-helix transcriptional regulator [Olsenella uli]MBM6676124.1 helix-turn-helix transcriptional regulator [Olsenella uli]
MAEKSEMPRERLTSELLDQLLNAPTPESYLDEGLTIDRTLPEYLEQLRAAKGLKRSEIIRASDVNATFVYDVFKGKSRLGRDNAIMLALGMGCTLEEAQRLLRLDGVAELWPKVRRDAIIIWCVNHGYTRLQTDEELYRLGEKTLFGTSPLA